MFSGLVRELGEIKSFDRDIIAIKSNISPDVSNILGSSIAVNGACLTVISYEGGIFKAEISSETKQIIAIENLRVGSLVHLEEALKIGDKLDGHLVQGHIDATATLKDVVSRSEGLDFYLEIPRKILPLVSNKGSICLDGISLTIHEVRELIIKISIIKYTLEQTLFKCYERGRRINVETDMFARHIYSIFKLYMNKEHDNNINILEWY